MGEQKPKGLTGIENLRSSKNSKFLFPLLSLDEMKEKSIFMHGNYPHYYGYRRKKSDLPFLLSTDDDDTEGLDSRLAAIKKNASVCFTGKSVLDIGCNDGTIPLEIAEHFQQVHSVLGIDIDESLIKKAKAQRQWKFSRIHPSAYSWKNLIDAGSDEQDNDEKDNDEKDDHNVDIDNDNHIENSVNFKSYFPASFGSSYGHVPMITNHPYFGTLCKELYGKLPFPFNVDFNCMNILEQTPQQSFDIITCFSVTKWIHLNGGDEAIERLFDTVHRLLAPGGFFILEPQPWKSYYSKSRFDPRLAENYQKRCHIKPDEFVSLLLTKRGFSLISEIVPDSNTKGLKGFQRSIFILSKQ